ncbi:MAG: hypothetical protein QW692_02590 [Nitrososphaerota archaeon]
MSRKPRIREAAIGDGLKSCDVCGHVDKAERFISIYFGDKGQKIDLCSKCLREGTPNAERK